MTSAVTITSGAHLASPVNAFVHERQQPSEHDMETITEPTTTTTKPTPATAEYTCPMHPESVSSAPGRCPTCNMQLEVKQPPASAKTSSCCG